MPPPRRITQADLAAANLGTALRRNLEGISALPIEELLQKRYDKFRKLGKFAEEPAPAEPATAEAE